jgi:outer membrane protein insertion porin family
LYAKASVQYGQHASGYTVSFVEPYLLGYRVALGLDGFQRINKATNYVSYDTRTAGGGFRLGFPLREDFGVQFRYSLYSQKVSLPLYLQNCNNINPDFNGTFPTPIALAQGLFTVPAGALQSDCFVDGEASLAVRRELAGGSVLTSLVGYDLTYNTLDNNRSPTSGLLALLKQDFAGVGGDVQFVRTTADMRAYYEVLPDVIGALHLQGGHITSFNCGNLITPQSPGPGENGCMRMLDHFQMGPQLVRGFAPNGIGPRDLTLTNYNGLPGDALGGTMYWGASVELQTPVFFAPKDYGIKLAVFADAGSLWNYAGPTSWLPPLPGATGETLALSNNNMFVNTSVGAGILWASPFGPIRLDFAYPVTKQSFDRTQWFRFSGGTTF